MWGQNEESQYQTGGRRESRESQCCCVSPLLPLRSPVQIAICVSNDLAHRAPAWTENPVGGATAVQDTRRSADGNVLRRELSSRRVPV